MGAKTEINTVQNTAAVIDDVLYFCTEPVYLNNNDTMYMLCHVSKNHKCTT